MQEHFSILIHRPDYQPSKPQDQSPLPINIAVLLSPGSVAYYCGCQCRLHKRATYDRPQGLGEPYVEKSHRSMLLRLLIALLNDTETVLSRRYGPEPCLTPCPRSPTLRLCSAQTTAEEAYGRCRRRDIEVKSISTVLMTGV